MYKFCWNFLSRIPKIFTHFSLVLRILFRRLRVYGTIMSHFIRNLWYHQILQPWYLIPLVQIGVTIPKTYKLTYYVVGSKKHFLQGVDCVIMIIKSLLRHILFWKLPCKLVEEHHRNSELYEIHNTSMYCTIHMY